MSKKIKVYKPISPIFLSKAQRGGGWGEMMYGKLPDNTITINQFSTPRDMGYKYSLDNAKLYQSFQQQQLQKDSLEVQKEQNEWDKVKSLIEQDQHDQLLQFKKENLKHQQNKLKQESGIELAKLAAGLFKNGPYDEINSSIFSVNFTPNPSDLTNPEVLNEWHKNTMDNTNLAYMVTISNQANKAIERLNGIVNTRDTKKFDFKSLMEDLQFLITLRAEEDGKGKLSEDDENKLNNILKKTYESNTYSKMGKAETAAITSQKNLDVIISDLKMAYGKEVDRILGLSMRNGSKGILLKAAEIMYRTKIEAYDYKPQSSSSSARSNPSSKMDENINKLINFASANPDPTLIKKEAYKLFGDEDPELVNQLVDMVIDMRGNNINKEAGGVYIEYNNSGVDLAKSKLNFINGPTSFDKLNSSYQNWVKDPQNIRANRDLLRQILSSLEISPDYNVRKYNSGNLYKENNITDILQDKNWTKYNVIPEELSRMLESVEIDIVKNDYGESYIRTTAPALVDIILKSGGKKAIKDYTIYAQKRVYSKNKGSKKVPTVFHIPVNDLMNDSSTPTTNFPEGIKSFDINLMNYPDPTSEMWNKKKEDIAEYIHNSKLLYNQDMKNIELTVQGLKINRDYGLSEDSFNNMKKGAKILYANINHLFNNKLVFNSGIRDKPGNPSINHASGHAFDFKFHNRDLNKRDKLEAELEKLVKVLNQNPNITPESYTGCTKNKEDTCYRVKIAGEEWIFINEGNHIHAHNVREVEKYKASLKRK